MHNPRLYGSSPYQVAVIHGGPGAPGEMAPVARELSKDFGVIEPLQTAATIQGQIDELYEMLDDDCMPPITLLGWSWGAILSVLFAAQHPRFVNKLILVGSAPFEASQAEDIMHTRMMNLSNDDLEELDRILSIVQNPHHPRRIQAFALLSQITFRADSHDPFTFDTELVKAQPEIYDSVWAEAREMRESGELLEQVKHIKCPVVAIHGKDDPHPYKGIQDCLEPIIDDFRMILLENCGHHPWLERHARSKFFQTLHKELKDLYG